MVTSKKRKKERDLVKAKTWKEYVKQKALIAKFKEKELERRKEIAKQRIEAIKYNRNLKNYSEQEKAVLGMKEKSLPTYTPNKEPKSARRVLVETALSQGRKRIIKGTTRRFERLASKKFLMKKQSLRRLKDTGAGIMPRRALPIHYEPIVKNLGGRPRKTTNKISSDILNQDYVFGGK